MKKFVAIFLTFILIFSVAVPSYASMIDNMGGVSPNATLAPQDVVVGDPKPWNPGLGNGEAGTGDDFFKDMWDFFNKCAEIICTPLIEFAINMPTVDGSIWAQQDTFQLSFFSASNTGFAGSIQHIIGGLYNTMRYAVAAIYIIILVYLGIRMILSSIGKQKAHYKTLIQYWLTGLLLLFAFHWVMAFTIWVSDVLTNTMATTGVAQIESISQGMQVQGLSGDPKNVTEYIISLIRNTDKASVWSMVGIFVQLFLLVALIAFGLFITITYAKRLFTVALLIVLFPLVVLSYVFDKIGDRHAQTFGHWLKEFLTNVFVQPIHALLLLVISYLLGFDFIKNTPVIGATLALLLLALLPIGEKLIKQLFQINSSMGAGSGGLSGAMSTLAHAGIAANQLKRLGSSVTSGITSNVQDRINKTKNKLAAISTTNKELNDVAKKAKARARKLDPNISRKDLNKRIREAKQGKWNQLKNSEQYKTQMKALGQKNGSFFRDMKHNGLGKAVKSSLHDYINHENNIGENIFGGMRLGYNGAKRILRAPAKGIGKTLAFAGKAFVATAGAGIGFGRGIISSTDIEALAGNVLKGSITGAGTGILLGNAVGTLGKNMVNTAKGIIPGKHNIPDDLKDAEVLAKLKLSDLSDEEKQKLAKVTGLELPLITDDNKELIKERVATRKMLASYGLNYNNTYATAFDSDSVEIANLRSGKDAYTGKDLNIQDYDSMQTKNALYLKHKRTGQVFQLNGHGNVNASNNPTWRKGELTDGDFINERVDEATELVNQMNKGGVGSKYSAFATPKQYDDYLHKETLHATRDAQFLNKTLSDLANSSHNIMAPKSATLHSSATRFSSVEDLQNLSHEQLASVNSEVSDFTHSVSTRLSAYSVNDSASKLVATSALTELYSKNATCATAIENACMMNGTSFEALKNGDIPDYALQNIATDINNQLSSRFDNTSGLQASMRVDVANNLDLNNRIDDLMQNGSLSYEGINNAISAATGGQVKSAFTYDSNGNPVQSDELKNWISNHGLQEKASIIDYCTLYSRAEQFGTPTAPTIIAAQREGKINTSVNISNASTTDYSSILGSSDRIPVEIRHYQDSTTGTYKMTATSITDPSKSVTFDTDMPVSNGEIISYAGNFSVDANGNAQLLRSEEELGYTFENPDAVVETFNDITYSDLKAWTPTTDKKFTMVRNGDILAVLDEKQQVILVREGMPTYANALTEFNVEVDKNGDFQLTSSPFATVKPITNVKFMLHSRDIKDKRPEEVKLIERLFNKS